VPKYKNFIKFNAYLPDVYKNWNEVKGFGFYLLANAAIDYMITELDPKSKE